MHWDPSLSELKLLQTRYLLRKVEPYQNTATILIAGDFNSEPASDVYELFITGNCTEQLQLKTNLTFGDLLPLELTAETPNENTIKDKQSREHQLYLHSAYGNYREQGEPKFTNVNTGFVGTLDYLFFESAKLLPLTLLELPEENTLGVMSLPNQLFSSDHICLRAEFAINSAY